MPFAPITARRLACAALLLSGCGEAPERETGPAPAATAAPRRAAAEAGAAVVDRGVCPFECCVYGEWRALRPVEVHVAEGDTSNLSFRLAAGERFTARSGNVHLDPVGLAVARRPVTIGEVDPGGPIELEAGDTVEVLAPIGEGFHRMRRGDRVVASAGFWEGAEGELVRAPEWEWWVEIQSTEGRRGWVEMRRLGPNAVWGADACGGPEPGSGTAA